jgi:hypothetical protein
MEATQLGFCSALLCSAHTGELVGAGSGNIFENLLKMETE